MAANDCYFDEKKISQYHEAYVRLNDLLLSDGDFSKRVLYLAASKVGLFFSNQHIKTDEEKKAVALLIRGGLEEMAKQYVDKNVSLPEEAGEAFFVALSRGMDQFLKVSFINQSVLGDGRKNIRGC